MDDPSGPGGPPEAPDLLRGALGIEAADAYRLIGAALGPGGDEVAGLVEATGIPHRRVLEILRLAGVDATDRAVSLTDQSRAALCRLQDARPRSGTEVGGVAGIMAEVAAGLPPPRASLDHVPATVETILRRAAYLRDTYELSGAHLVCVGDHDLTSVAAALLAPGLTVSVVDIDERLLEYLGRVSDRLGLGLALYGADLRLGLPRSLRGVADLVFTDPPYSEEGVALFVQRGVEALAERPGARVLFCYGVSDRGAEQLLAVQDALVRRHIVVEALLPGFNRYHGAHAIGATSALWVCRPTRRTRPTLERMEATARREGRIYSRGAASRESESSILTPAVREAAVSEAAVSEAAVREAAVREAAGQTPGEQPAIMVGDEWAAPDLGPGTAAERLSIGEFLDSATELPRPGSSRQGPATALVNLDRFYGTSLVRVLCAAAPGWRVVVVGEAGSLALPADLRSLVEARFEITVRPAAGAALLVAEPLPGPDPAAPLGEDGGPAFVLRFIQERQAAKLRNAWREALCALAARRGGTCTKNQARSLINATAVPPAELDAHLLELPLHRLAALGEAVRATVEGVARLTPPAPQAG